MDGQTKKVIKIVAIGLAIGFVLGKVIDIDIKIKTPIKRAASNVRDEVVKNRVVKDELELCYFEKNSDMRKIEQDNATAGLSKDKVSQGSYSLKVVYNDGGGAIGFYNTLPKNWTGYKSFKFDVYTDEEGLPLSLFVKDRKNTSYGDRYNKDGIRLYQGWNEIEVPIEAIDAKLFMHDIHHIRLFLWKVPGEHTLYFDNMRLIGK